MKTKLFLLILLASFSFSFKSFAQLTLIGSFNPAEGGSLCGIGFDPDSSHIWTYGCNEDVIRCYDISGNLLNSFASPGGVANDVDVEISTSEILFNDHTLPQGQLLFINGETDAAEIYAIENATGNVIDTLSSNFGNDHVVGGAYHSGRNTFFLLQDNVPGSTLENMIGEIDPMTGDTVNTFQITEYFAVSYGDIEVAENGNLFVVSSIEDAIAEFSPDETFIQLHPLPEGVSALSGIALDCSAGEAWVTGTSGVVYHLGQFPCGEAASIKESMINSVLLSDIYPNPFLSSFDFSIETSQSTHLKIRLLNMIGQEIHVIYDGLLTEGRNDFSYKDESLKKGIYILLAESSEFIASKRIICTR